MLSCNAFVSLGSFVGEVDSMRVKFRGSFIGDGDLDEGIRVCFLSLSISCGVGFRPGSECDIGATGSAIELWRVGGSRPAGFGREGVLVEERLRWG